MVTTTRMVCKYNQAWENDYAWLRYSVSKDAAFCSYHLLFGNWVQGSGVHSNVFQCTGSYNWKNAKCEKYGALPTHEASDSHKIAATKVLKLKQVEPRIFNVLYPRHMRV